MFARTTCTCRGLVRMPVALETTRMRRINLSCALAAGTQKKNQRRSLFNWCVSVFFCATLSRTAVVAGDACFPRRAIRRKVTAWNMMITAIQKAHLSNWEDGGDSSVFFFSFFSLDTVSSCFLVIHIGLKLCWESNIHPCKLQPSVWDCNLGPWHMHH